MPIVFRMLLITLTLFGCSEADNSTTQNDSVSTTESVARTALARSAANSVTNLVIAEHRLGEIPLPFPQSEMIVPLTAAFDNYSVSKEIGRQDGPDFPLYSIKINGLELAYFKMDWQHTLKLNAVYIKDAFIEDQYGLAVGDDYQQILKLREGVIDTGANYHMHTYAQIKGSNIMYEISDDSPSGNTLDLKNTKLTAEQLSNWRITQIIWRQ